MNVLIIENNPAQADELRNQIELALEEGLSSVEIKESGEAALQHVRIAEKLPDVVFADIDLGDSNGIDIARQILEAVPNAKIIFVSGYDDYYLDVYDVEHIWFLRKPVETEVLRRALQRVADRMTEDEGEYFFYEANRRKITVPLRSILFMESDKRVIHIHTDGDPLGNEHMFYGTLKNVAAQFERSSLPEHSAFLRCHQSHIVNLNRVSAFDTDAFYIGNQKVPVSRRYKRIAEEAFVELLEKRMGGI
jgi:DNA-binding LytR/AlgR family response regulator